jgi:hypothetical protein
VLQKLIAEKLQKAIQQVLKVRFGSVPRDVSRLLREILDERKLTQLTDIAAGCPDLDAFRAALLA